MEKIPLSKIFPSMIVIKARATKNFPNESTPYLPYINLMNFSFKLITFLFLISYAFTY